MKSILAFRKNFSIDLKAQGENEIVNFTDLSKSGIFINNSKVGHGKSLPIKNGDNISIANESHKFEYLRDVDISGTTDESSESVSTNSFEADFFFKTREGLQIKTKMLKCG